MNYFEQKLKTILENRYLSDEWVTPDDIYYFSDALGGITFIDYNDDFVYGDIGETHPKVADRTEELEGQKRGTLLDHAILGRSALFSEPNEENHWQEIFGFIDNYPSFVISFWDMDITEEEINRVSQKVIEAYNVPDMDTYVSSYPHGIMKYGSRMSKKESTPEREKEYELQRQLHLMRPEQKKAAMQQLGLGSSGKPSAGQRAGLTPGQKYWAMSSEGRK
jgi:hypothetical protein